MGKASSAKKVARVARSSGTSSGPRQRFRLGFGALIALILVLGVLLVAWSRASRPGTGGPDAGEEWTITWGVYVCDAFVPGVGGTTTIQPVPDADNPDQRLNVGAWAPSVDLAVTADAITLPDGRQLTNGFDCGGTPAEVSITTWPAGAAADAGLTRSFSLDTLQFSGDGEQLTLAVVAPGTTIPQPPATPEPAPETTTTAAPGGETPASTEPATSEPPADSTTTVP
jgi:hypothetical protein